MKKAATGVISYKAFPLRQIFIALFLLCVVCNTTIACTIFVLTDGTNTYFFNNEDYTNPNTRVWFVPEGEGHYGCAFVGFDDGSAQGGVNTAGLAFDWYAGGAVDYTPSNELDRIDDNSSERMLEMCTTVDEAIAFYQTYAEPGFARATILIADKSGASVVIGARDGKLYFERSNKSRVLGYGQSIFNRTYAGASNVTLSSGAHILKQCVADGKGGTKYSNVFDLNTGDITFYNFFNEEKNTVLNLFAELGKGGHYYEIPRLQQQVKEPLRPLSLNMRRLVLFNFKPLDNQEKAITSMIKKTFSETGRGILHSEHLSEKLREELDTDPQGVSFALKKLGSLSDVHLIHKEKRDGTTLYSYIMMFSNARILWEFNISIGKEIQDMRTLSAYSYR